MLKIWNYFQDKNNIARIEAISAFCTLLLIGLIALYVNKSIIAQIHVQSIFLASLYVLIAVVGVIAQGFFAFKWHDVGDNTAKKLKLKRGSLYMFYQYFLNIGLSALGWTSGFVLIFARNIIPLEDRAVYLLTISFIAVAGMTGLLPYILTRSSLR